MSDLIHHVAVSRCGQFFATAEFKHRVSVWSMARRRLVATFDTTLDFGGRRLVITEGNFPLVVAGAYHVHGIAAYAFDSGAEVWRRKDLKKCQTLFAVSSTHVMASFEKGNCCLIRLSDGKSHHGPKGVVGIEGVDQSGRVLLETKVQRSEKIETRLRVWRDGTAGFDWTSPPAKRAVHTGAASTSQVVVTDMSGDAAAYSSTGAELWRKNFGRIVQLVWVSGTELFAGVIYPDKSGETQRLILFRQDGTIKHIEPLAGALEVGFSGDGKYLITSNGEVRTLPALDLAWKFR